MPVGRLSMGGKLNQKEEATAAKTAHVATAKPIQIGTAHFTGKRLSLTDSSLGSGVR